MILKPPQRVIVGVKHCSVFSESGGSGKSYASSLMTKRDRMRVILSSKYFENVLHCVPSED